MIVVTTVTGAVHRIPEQMWMVNPTTNQLRYALSTMSWLETEDGGIVSTAHVVYATQIKDNTDKSAAPPENPSW